MAESSEYPSVLDTGEFWEEIGETEEFSLQISSPLDKIFFWNFRFQP